MNEADEGRIREIVKELREIGDREEGYKGADILEAAWILENCL